MSGMFAEHGLKAYGRTYCDVTLYGALGKAHTSVYKSACNLIHNPEASFPLNGDGFETRKGKFTHTIETFFNGAGAVGSVVGTGVMGPADWLVGLGRAPDKGEVDMFINEGLLGNSLIVFGSLASGAAEYVGKGTGAIAAAVSMPVKFDDVSPKKWIQDGANTGGKFVGKVAGHVLGTGLGLAIDVARTPSIIVKAALKGSFAVVGGIVGFFAASVRAIFNK